MNEEMDEVDLAFPLHARIRNDSSRIEEESNENAQSTDDSSCYQNVFHLDEDWLEVKSDTLLKKNPRWSAGQSVQNKHNFRKQLIKE